MHMKSSSRIRNIAITSYFSAILLLAFWKIVTRWCAKPVHSSNYLLVHDKSQPRYGTLQPTWARIQLTWGTAANLTSWSQNPNLANKLSTDQHMVPLGRKNTYSWHALLWERRREHWGRLNLYPKQVEKRYRQHASIPQAISFVWCESTYGHVPPCGLSHDRRCYRT